MSIKANTSSIQNYDNIKNGKVVILIEMVAYLSLIKIIFKNHLYHY